MKIYLYRHWGHLLAVIAPNVTECKELLRKRGVNPADCIHVREYTLEGYPSKEVILDNH